MASPRAILAAAALLLVARPAAAYSMTFGPSALPLIQQPYYNASMWSWGGSVVEVPGDPKNRYHMWAAAFTEGCGLSAWESNSQVIHAVSNDPLGPFAFTDVAVPVWAHNPQAVVANDGTFLLFTLGFSEAVRAANCSAAGAGGAARSRLDGHPPETMTLHSSESPYGPWDLVAENIFTGTNPAPWINEDGSVYVASHNGSVITVSVASTWRGPYSSSYIVTARPLEPDVNLEDPFLWFDKAAQKWRILGHMYNATDHKVQINVGFTAWSANASITSAWTSQAYTAPVFLTAVGMSDGSTLRLSRRERPKLLLDAVTGAPAVLYTGVCPDDSSSNCYTMGVPILSTSD